MEVDIVNISYEIDQLCQHIKYTHSVNAPNESSEQLSNLLLLIRHTDEVDPLGTLLACGLSKELLHTIKAKDTPTDHLSQVKGIITTIAQNPLLGNAYYTLIYHDKNAQASQLVQVALQDPIALATNPNLLQLIETGCSIDFHNTSSDDTLIFVENDLLRVLESLTSSEDVTIALGRNFRISTIKSSFQTLGGISNNIQLPDRINSALHKVEQYIIDRTDLSIPFSPQD